MAPLKTAELNLNWPQKMYRKFVNYWQFVGRLILFGFLVDILLFALGINKKKQFENKINEMLKKSHTFITRLNGKYVKCVE